MTKIKIKVAEKGQKVIDLVGFVYTVQEVHEKYILVGNGQKLVHQDYEIIPSVLEEDINLLAETIKKIHSKTDESMLDSIISKVLTRFEDDWREQREFGCTFEEYVEFEGERDSYEYEYPKRYENHC